MGGQTAFLILYLSAPFYIHVLDPLWITSVLAELYQTPVVFLAGHNQEELQLEEEELQLFLDAIDQLALAFSRR